MPEQPEISILVAAFNEEENMEACIRSIATAMPDSEIVIVHGGTDATLDVARSLQSEFPQIIPIYNENDRGKGHAIKAGAARARGNIIAQFDADLQFAAKDLPALTAPIREGLCDVTLGSRFTVDADCAAYQPSFFRDIGNRLLCIYVSCLCGRKTTDVTAGIKAWTRSAFEQIDFRDDAYSYEAEIVIRAHRLGLRVEEIPVTYASRTMGASMHADNLQVIRAGLTILLKSLNFRFGTYK
ncbi:MAG: glycosyltransferase family 2 protein [Verrucomicrobiae bacterium]|nr:glycosyltransferase family 2 protein [Verrucomicrobiae bacterium]